MPVFIDTSAFCALINAKDVNHDAASGAWQVLGEQGEMLCTSNYVLVETIAVLTRQLGLEALRDFHIRFVPVLEVHWIDEPIHRLAMAALLTAGRRQLSLVDCTSFEVMRRLGLETAFVFDPHFGEQGFSCIP
ncbi:MAG: PIN domain-containing protein [Dehalococcoidia bacterium]|nr:PIN domain-containing protein [Dehalococcoidia bacterium]